MDAERNNPNHIYHEINDNNVADNSESDYISPIPRPSMEDSVKRNTIYGRVSYNSSDTTIYNEPYGHLPLPILAAKSIKEGDEESIERPKHEVREEKGMFNSSLIHMRFKGG